MRMLFKILYCCMYQLYSCEFSAIIYVVMTKSRRARTNNAVTEGIWRFVPLLCGFRDSQIARQTLPKLASFVHLGVITPLVLSPLTTPLSIVVGLAD